MYRQTTRTLPLSQLAANIVPPAVELCDLLVEAFKVDVFARPRQRRVRQRRSRALHQPAAILRVVVHLVYLNLLLADRNLHS